MSYIFVMSESTLTKPSPIACAERIGPYSFLQSPEGHKLTSDTLCLTGFMLPLPEDAAVIDLGTGTGAIPLILAWRSPARHITGVEIDPSLCALARSNAASNALTDRIAVINADLREMKKKYRKGSFDAVVSNPPYRKAGSGRKSPRKARETARCETATLRELIDVSCHLAGSRGRMFYVFPVTRLFEMLRESRLAGLSARRLCFVHTRAVGAARFFLIELGATGGLTIEEPIFL